MGDLQKFLSGSNEPETVPSKRRPDVRLLWLALVPILAGALWIYAAWRQVKKARLEKERLALQIDSLSQLHERLQEEYIAAEVGPEHAAPPDTLSAAETVPAVATAPNVPPAAAPSPPKPNPTAAVPTLVKAETRSENVTPPAGPGADAEEESPFLIVAGAAKTLEDAQIDVERLRRTGIDQTTIYLRNDQFRVVAGPFARGQTNAQLEKIKTKVNASAYLVRTEDWCAGGVRREGYVECRL